MTKRKEKELTRPPRVFYDKKQERYFIKAGKEKLYFKKGTTYDEAVKQALTKMKISPRQARKFSVRSAYSKPLKPIDGFNNRKDSKLVQVQNIEDKAKLDLAEYTKHKARAEAEKAKADAEAAKKLESETTKRLEETKQTQREEEVKRIRHAADEEIRLARQREDLTKSQRDEEVRRIRDLASEEIKRTQHLGDLKQQQHNEELKRAHLSAIEATARANAVIKNVGDRLVKEVVPAFSQAKSSKDHTEMKRIINTVKVFGEELSGTQIKYEPDQLKQDPPVNIPPLEVPAAPVTDVQGAPVDVPAGPVAKQEGNGRLEEQVKKDGLYSDQIEEMMKDYKPKGFLGVISADEVVKLIQESLKFDKFGWVMNKDTADKPGSHWVAVYCDLDGDCSIDYYDSFAEDPDHIFLEQIKQLIDSHDLTYYLKMKINRIKQQAENSSLCGFHAMRFLMDRFKGKKFVEASGYSEVRSSEKAAKGLMEKFERFGYI